MNLSTVRSRLDRLLEAQGPTNGPLAVLCLPANGRGPDAEEALPLPRVAWRSRAAACVVYDPALGQPSSETVGQLCEVTL
jgi:hypothetical protein